METGDANKGLADRSEGLAKRSEVSANEVRVWAGCARLIEVKVVPAWPGQEKGGMWPIALSGWTGWSLQIEVRACNSRSVLKPGASRPRE